MSEPTLPEAYGRALAGLGAATLGALEGLEWAQRRLHPPHLPRLRSALGPVRDRLEEALAAFAEVPMPEGLEAFHTQLAQAGEEAQAALALFLDPGPPDEAVARILASGRRACRAQEACYPLRSALPAFGRFFAEPAWHDRLAALDPDPEVSFGAGTGLHRTGEGGDPDARGGFSLYVPEWLSGDAPRALVVALHGGSGHGRDFLWTWLREARSRGFLLLAPTSVGGTWSLDAAERDAAPLRSMVAWVSERWPVDASRILLTGLSDGGTFALLAGLAEDAPYTALAPVAGVLHPRALGAGGRARLAGRRIYQVHGAHDWLFPVAIARVARDELVAAGAELVYRELDDLSHTYPREENARILAWFDPTLVPPES